VLQELLLHGHGSQFTTRLESIRELTELLPIDTQQAESLLGYARELRNRAVHSNDLLILRIRQEINAQFGGYIFGEMV